MLTSLILLFAQTQSATIPPTLSLGSPAPALAIQKWLKGQPIQSFDKDHVYLIEFWATWCGPCMNAIHHLSALQKQYGPKGLEVISIAAPDRYGNDLPTIKKCIKEHDAKMAYRIAFDAESEKAYMGVFRGQTIHRYMAAANWQQYPVSFVVDKAGKVVFIGIPSLADGVIEEALRGPVDVTKRAQELAVYKQSEDKINDYFSLFNAKKFEEANALAHQLIDGPFKSDAKMNWLIGNAIVDVLNDVPNPDMALAERCINMAVQATRGNDVNMNASLACLKFRQGKKAEAIALMRKLVSQSEHPAEREWMQKRLDIMLKTR
ncbi:MAG: TlpA family protein disulfide reductase [Armatimonadetes bacterium]|nr:TlpA family protein disulfide reductase [Armatimonadota bacterium]